MEKCSRGLFVALLLGLAWTGGAMAQEAAKDAAKDPLSFEVADANHDGALSRSEVPKQLTDLRAHFTQYDKNGDHRLSPDEYEDGLAATAARACDNQEISRTQSNCGVAWNPGFSRREPADLPKSQRSAASQGGNNNGGGGGNGGQR